MDNLTRCFWLRQKGTIWASFSLLMIALFSWSTPAIAASKSNRVVQTSGNSAKPWIDIDLSSQRLSVLKGKKRLYSVAISSGKRATPTLTGTFRIQSKYRTKRMRGEDYDVPNVPYAMFYSGGYAIHGAYWHNKFGTPMSHGCVNVPVGTARKLFRLAKVGTKVVVHQ
jgi:lipoprotein-anchoring transpeptidase ErfK/SrfK